MLAIKEKKSPRILIPENLNPHILRVLKTYTTHLNLELIHLPTPNGVIDINTLVEELQSETAAVIIQNPNFLGLLENIPELLEIIKMKDAVSICYALPLTLGLLEAPGHLGADIVVGEGQSLGLPLSFGGPYLGLMAVSERFMRRIPGRLVGETIDNNGKRAFVLTLQTREQHIRREKATSNICSNQALCALSAAIYLSVIGPEGLVAIGQRAFDNAHYLYNELLNIGLKPLFNAPFFMEFAMKTPIKSGDLIEQLLKKGLLAGFDLAKTNPKFENSILFCATEIFSKEQLDRFVAELRCLL